MGDPATLTALWGAVIVSGIYHGVSPGMGWPLAVSAALMASRKTALITSLGALALGHFLAMAMILLPFSVTLALVEHAAEIRVAAGLLVIALGVYLLLNPRHPKMLARIRPDQLTLWSFLAAMAHGAGLMLVPIYLGICAVDADTGHQAAGALMTGNLGTAFLVAAIHTLAMTLAGGVLATAVYFWLGLTFLSRTWFRLDIAWALSLILVGAVGLSSAGHA